MKYTTLYSSKTYSNSLVLPDLSSDVDTRPEVDGREETGTGTGEAAVTYSLCVLTNDVAWAEVSDDAYRG